MNGNANFTQKGTGSFSQVKIFCLSCDINTLKWGELSSNKIIMWNSKLTIISENEKKSFWYACYMYTVCMQNFSFLIYLSFLSNTVYIHIPVNLSDPHCRRSPAIQNEIAGDLARRLFWVEILVNKKSKHMIQTLLYIY